MYICLLGWYRILNDGVGLGAGVSPPSPPSLGGVSSPGGVGDGSGLTDDDEAGALLDAGALEEASTLDEGGSGSGL